MQPCTHSCNISFCIFSTIYFNMTYFGKYISLAKISRATDLSPRSNWPLKQIYYTKNQDILNICLRSVKQSVNIKQSLTWVTALISRRVKSSLQRASSSSSLHRHGNLRCPRRSSCCKQSEKALLVKQHAEGNSQTYCSKRKTPKTQDVLLIPISRSKQNTEARHVTE